MQAGKPETLRCAPSRSRVVVTCRVGFFKLGTVDFKGRVPRCGGLPWACKAMSRVQGLRLLDASGALTHPNSQQSNMSPDVVSILNLPPEGRRGIEMVPVAGGGSGLISAWGGGYIWVCTLKSLTDGSYIL